MYYPTEINQWKWESNNKLLYNVSSRWTNSRGNNSVCWHFLQVLVGEKFFRLFCCHIFPFLFLSALKSDNSTLLQLIILRHKFILASTQNSHCSNTCLLHQTKMGLSWAQNIFKSANTHSLVFIMILWARLFESRLT